MLQRKEKKSSNTWYKLARPMITSGEDAGKRDSERITFSLQVIPDGAFTLFGERKITGFTVEEIRKVYETGEPMYLMAEEVEDTVLAKLEIGPREDQVTKDELKQVLDAVAKSGILLSPSPLDKEDRLRIAQEKETVINIQLPESIIEDANRAAAKIKEAAEETRAVTGTDFDPDGSGGTGEDDSEDDEFEETGSESAF